MGSHAALQLLDDVAWVTVDQNGTLKEWSSAAAELFGYSRVQALDLNIQDCLTASPVLPLDRPIDRFEFEAKKASGERIPIFAKIRPTHDGEVAISFESMYSSVAGSARFLGLVGDAMPEMVAYIDTEGRFLYTNRAYREWFSSDELVGKTLVEVINPQTKQSLLDRIASALQGNVVRYEKWGTRPNGETRYVETALVPDIAEDGRVLGFLTHTVDATRQEVARAALVESEQRLKIALESGRMGAWQYDFASDRFAWTPGVAEIHHVGQESSNLSYEQFLEGVDPLDLEQLQQQVEHAIQEGEYDATYRYKTRDGKLIWVESRGRLHRDEEGNPDKLIGVCRDITTRKTTEQALRESEERYRLLAEAIPQIVWAANREGFIVYANHRFTTFTGEEAKTKVKWESFVHPEDLPRVFSLLEIAREGKDEFDVAVRLRRQDGDYRWHLCRISPLLDGEGNITRWFGSCADIHELRETQEALQEQTKALELVNQIGLLLNRDLDLKRVVQALTETSTELTGAQYGAFFQPAIEDGETRFDVLAMSGIPPALVAKLPKPRGLGVLSKTLVLGRTVRVDDLEVQGVLPMGHFTLRSYLAVPVKSSASRVIGAMVFGHSESGMFTERHERILLGVASQAAIAMDNARLYGELSEVNADLEKRVHERTRELESAYREMEGFTYSVSHDLRAPLRAINSTSKMLIEDFGGQLSPEGAAMLLRQADASQRLGVLIDELLRMSRISRQEIRFEPLSLSDLALEVVEELSEQVEEKRLSIQVEPDLSAVGDPRLVKFVLLNLISNAVKFSVEGGEIAVRSHSNGAVCVQDHGIGFDMRYEPKLWLPFERLVAEQEYPGTGIGLTNVKRIVERHGGHVWAESVMGEGSTFYFTLGPS